jgi:cytochrome c oxidase cbb3-type subunit III
VLLIRFNRQCQGWLELPFMKRSRVITRLAMPNRLSCHVVTLGGIFPIVLIGACVAFVRAAHAQDTPQTRPPQTSPINDASLAEGRQIFEGRCAACHGLDARGGERAPDIATRPVVQQRTDAKLYEIIKGGNPTAGMPAFPSLDEGTIKSLIAYLRVLQGKGPATAIPGNPRNGEALFFGKARCSECHSLNGKGGFLASDLSAFGRGRSPAEIRDAITKPRESRANAVVLVTSRNGEKFTGIIRNEDNFSLQLQALDGSFHLLMKPQISSVASQSASLMPTDYASSLSGQQLDDLAGFLMTVANKSHTSAKQPREDEDEE